MWRLLQVAGKVMLSVATELSLEGKAPAARRSFFARYFVPTVLNPRRNVTLCRRRFATAEDRGEGTRFVRYREAARREAAARCGATGGA
jgi:hypothetical protein